MSKIVRNKEQITATVTPYLKRRCVEVAEGPDFTSISDIVTQALSEFFTKYDERKARETKKYDDDAMAAFVLSLKQSNKWNDFVESFDKSNQGHPIETEEFTNSKFQELIKTMCNSCKEKSFQ